MSDEPSSKPSDREQWRRYIARLDAERGRLVDEVEADVAPYCGLSSMERRGQLVADLADTAWKTIQARPRSRQGAGLARSTCT